MELDTAAGARMRAAGIRTRADFAATLTGLRESAGLSVRDVARRSGIAASTAGGYFSGRHLPPLTVPETLESLLRALGVTHPAEHDAWVEALRRVRRRPRPVGADWFLGREHLLERAVLLLCPDGVERQEFLDLLAGHPGLVVLGLPGHPDPEP